METLLRAGDVVGGFRVDDVIGIGGMAIVYRAEQVSLGRPVALKVLSRKLTNDAVFRERFRREQHMRRRSSIRTSCPYMTRASRTATYTSRCV